MAKKMKKMVGTSCLLPFSFSLSLFATDDDIILYIRHEYTDGFWSPLPEVGDDNPKINTKLMTDTGV